MTYFQVLSTYLPNTVAMKAIYNCERNPEIEYEFSVGCVLAQAFKWNKSPEAFNYWNNIYEEYKDVLLAIDKTTLKQ